MSVHSVCVCTCFKLEAAIFKLVNESEQCFSSHKVMGNIPVVCSSVMLLI